MFVDDDITQAKLLQMGRCAVIGGIVNRNNATRIHTGLQQTIHTLLCVIQAIVGGEGNGVINHVAVSNNLGLD
jgi:hypothetical protein